MDPAPGEVSCAPRIADMSVWPGNVLEPSDLGISGVQGSNSDPRELLEQKWTPEVGIRNAQDLEGSMAKACGSSF